MPTSLTLTLANLIYIEKDALPQVLTNRLIRLAAFTNPGFHQSQALRLPVWNKPRLIGCAENFPHHIALPRGCLHPVCTNRLRKNCHRRRTDHPARRVNTLLLVHRTELLRQWQERLQTFLGCGKEMVGVIGGGKSKPTGRIDVAVMQSIPQQGETNPIVENYGQAIVNECHHLSAAWLPGDG